MHNKKVDLNSQEAYMQVIQLSCTTFTPKTNNIEDMMLKHWHVLQNDPSLKETFLYSDF